jgi:hypothetical protein
MFYFVVDPSEVPNELFTYRTSDDIGGHPYWGIFSTYGGGGYVTELGTTMTDASSTVDTIMNNNWVDNNTRAIFIEVNLYNPNKGCPPISSDVLYVNNSLGTSEGSTTK